MLKMVEEMWGLERAIEGMKEGLQYDRRQSFHCNRPKVIDLALEVYFFPFLFYCWPVWASMLLGCVGFLALVTKLRCTCQKIFFLSL